MRKVSVILAGMSALLMVSACSTEERVAEKQGEEVQDVAEGYADALEDKADEVRRSDPGPNSKETEAEADDLEDEAHAVRREGDVEAKEIRDEAREAAKEN